MITKECLWKSRMQERGSEPIKIQCLKVSTNCCTLHFPSTCQLLVLVQKNIEAQALLLLASRRELGTAPPKTHRRERREKREKEQATAGGLGLHRTDAALTGGNQIRGCDLQHGSARARTKGEAVQAQREMGSSCTIWKAPATTKICPTHSCGACQFDWRKARKCRAERRSHRCTVYSTWAPRAATNRDRRPSRTAHGRATKRPKNRSNQHEPFPRFAQVITTELEGYSREIIAQFEHKLRKKNQISPKNTVFPQKRKSARILIHKWN